MSSKRHRPRSIRSITQGSTIRYERRWSWLLTACGFMPSFSTRPLGETSPPFTQRMEDSQPRCAGERFKDALKFGGAFFIEQMPLVKEGLEGQLGRFLTILTQIQYTV